MLLSIIIIGIICFLAGIYMIYIFVKGADIRNCNPEAKTESDDEQMKSLAEMREREHVLETLS